MITKTAFVAQGLEHWSSKPGVESSILSEGIFDFDLVYLYHK